MSQSPSHRGILSNNDNDQGRRIFREDVSIPFASGNSFERIYADQCIKLTAIGLNPLRIGELFRTAGISGSHVVGAVSLNPLRIGELFRTLAKIQALESIDYTPIFQHPTKSTLSFRPEIPAPSTKISPEF